MDITRQEWTLIDMNERQIRKIQKNRHMNEILLNIASNSVFKNLSTRERGRMAKLIYKAELTEFYVRERDLTRTNNAFAQMVANILDQLESKGMRVDFDEDGDDPFGPIDGEDR